MITLYGKQVDKWLSLFHQVLPLDNLVTCLSTNPDAQYVCPVYLPLGSVKLVPKNACSYQPRCPP